MFLLIVALLGAAGVFFLAGATQNSGWWWSYELCHQGAIFCEHPSWILIAAGIAILFAMIRTMSEA
ncbi:MAG TPA: hypothetical protein VGC86_05345 [Afipia sp.]